MEPGVRQTVSTVPILIAACGLLVVLGSMGPWAKVFLISVDGTDGDGKITLVLGILAGFLALIRIGKVQRRAILSLSAALLLLGATIVGAYHWANISDLANDVESNEFFEISVSVGWGLILTTLCGAMGTILAVYDGLAAPRNAATPPEPTPERRPRQHVDPFRPKQSPTIEAFSQTVTPRGAPDSPPPDESPPIGS